MQKLRSRVKTYALIAYALLFVMALLSSIDDAFIYIFSGCSLFFASLAAQNWWTIYKSEPKIHFNRSSFGTGKKSASDFHEILWRFFMKSPDVAYVSPSERTQRKTILTILAAVFLIIFSFMVIVNISKESSENEFEITELKSAADGLYNNGNYDSASMFYRRALIMDENYSDGYYGLGNVKLQLKEFDSAQFYYASALEKNPDHLDALYGAGLANFNQQNYSRSIQELRKIFERTDSYLNAYLLTGDNYYFQEKYDSAILYYEPAYERGARSKELMNVMAYIYDVEGETAQAISFYEQTLEYDSTMVDIYKRLAELLPGPQGDVYRAKAAGR